MIESPYSVPLTLSFDILLAFFCFYLSVSFISELLYHMILILTNSLCISFYHARTFRFFLIAFKQHQCNGMRTIETEKTHRLQKFTQKRTKPLNKPHSTRINYGLVKRKKFIPIITLCLIFILSIAYINKNKSCHECM